MSIDFAPLKRYLSSQQLKLPEHAFGQLEAYLALLARWNKRMNLTAIDTPETMVLTHLCDSLSVLPYLQQHQNITDVGSGAGLPGIPLAIARPDLQVTLVETIGKRVQFCRQAVRLCGLSNVSVIESRVEAYQPSQPCEAIISRAFASLSQMLQLIVHLCDNETDVWAMKGQTKPEEICSIPDYFCVVAQHELNVPHKSHRTLVHCKKI